MLTPDVSWYWYVDEQRNCLSIALSETLHFATPYQVKQLIDIPRRPCPITLEQMAFFHELHQAILSVNVSYSDAEILQMLLNAMAAMFFHKHVAQKNWLYHEAEEPVQGDVFGLISTDHGQTTCLIFAVEGGSAKAITLDSLHLTDDKSIDTFSLIRVSTHRLSPVSTQVSLRQLRRA
ncbi:cell division protein ZapC [Aestuariibacter sp. AA17]|uniref:Cell division protein ZapC n=1 Tax=Fluctibacter corallii TaxID=2984329 RepID=A0ABT3A691_9ALTE|nr:cell division protein ZapC [Aestuariibacter sp. AA17]MCV2884150.1 cell division protein ZapC [Aestuariibacter sp. AA17]